MYKKVFTFGDGSYDNAVSVRTGDIYNEAVGYGFLTGNTKINASNAVESLRGGGFMPRANDCDLDYWSYAKDKNYGVELDLPLYPIRFKALVPEFGFYRISLKITSGDKPVSSLLIYTNRRNLVKHNVHIEKNRTIELSFSVFICGYKPAASNSVVEEKAVYVTLMGEYAVISGLTIEKANGPTIFISGDSTLTDQGGRFPYYPKENCGGWAQDLLSMLKGNIAVCNQAHSGLTSTCFREDGHWSLIENKLKPGDLFIMQFGHNDQKRRNLRARAGYSDNLRWYINEVRKRGAFPIIVTPLSRSGRNSLGEINDVLIEYAAACINLGYELKVPVIDLHAKSLEFVKSMNAEEASRYFMKGDITHTNDFGAMKMALFVRKVAVESGVTELAACFKSEEPEDFISLYSEAVPPSVPNSSTPEEIEIPFVDIACSPDLEWIRKAGNKGLLDICVMHLHPDSFLPRAQFVLPLSKALRLTTRSYVASNFSDVKITEWESDIINTMKDDCLIDDCSIREKLFRPDDYLTGEEAVTFLVRALKPKEQRSLSIEQCLKEGVNLGFLYEGFSPKDYITRSKVYRLLVSFMELSEDSLKEMPSTIEMHPIS